MKPGILIALNGRIYDEKSQEIHKRDYDNDYIKAREALDKVIKKSVRR